MQLHHLHGGLAADLFALLAIVDGWGVGFHEIGSAAAAVYLVARAVVFIRREFFSKPHSPK